MTERPQHLFLWMITVKHWRKTILGLSSFGVLFLTYLGLSQPQWMFRVVSQLRPGTLFVIAQLPPKGCCKK